MNGYDSFTTFQIMEVNQKFMEHCKAHVGCENCKGLTEEIEIDNVKCYCNTGREKNNS